MQCRISGVCFLFLLLVSSAAALRFVDYYGSASSSGANSETEQNYYNSYPGYRSWSSQSSSSSSNPSKSPLESRLDAIEVELKKWRASVGDELRTVKDGSEYLFVDHALPWYEAQESCADWGGRLAVPKSDKDNDFITKNMGLVPERWLGLSDIQREGDWKTAGDVSNESIDYVNWAKGEPDNGSHNENCASLRADGLWQDQLCILARAYVCERS